MIVKVNKLCVDFFESEIGFEDFFSFNFGNRDVV